MILAILAAPVTALITGTDTLSATKRAELRGRISTMPGLNRFLRTTPGGLLRIDKTKIASEANLDGKYLLRCSDPHLSAEDIAPGYKRLLQVERGWRDMKTTLQLRPVYHRLEDRIRAQVILCWHAAELHAAIGERIFTNVRRGIPGAVTPGQRLHDGMTATAYAQAESLMRVGGRVAATWPPTSPTAAAG